MALDLNAVHTDLVSDFLQLTRYQQTQRVKSVDHCFSKLLNYKVREDDTYSGDEVRKLIEELQEVVMDEVNAELQDAIHTNVLLVQQLLKQAEEWHLTLTTNVAELENREKLNAIKSYDDSQQKDPEKPKITVTHMKTVIPLEDYGAATALKQEVVQLLSQNSVLKKRVEELESGVIIPEEAHKKAGDLLPDHEALAGDLEQAQKEIEALSAALNAATNNSPADSSDNLFKVETALENIRRELDNTRRAAEQDREKLRLDLESRETKLRQVQSSLLLAEKELESKFQGTGAYANMKKMLVQKNRTIKELREKLAEAGSSSGSPPDGDEAGDGVKNEDEDDDYLEKEQEAADC